MKRLPLDQADRRVLGGALLLMLFFVLVCIAVGGGIGAGVLTYRVLVSLGG